MEALRSRLYDGMRGQRHHRRGRRRHLRARSRHSPPSASPRATRSASRSWSTPRPGSSSTTRPRSARRCSTPSRWASTRRSRWSRTPGGTACWCCGPDINASPAAACLERIEAERPAGQPAASGYYRARVRPSRRCGWGCPASAPSATELADRIVAEREAARRRTPSMADLARRVGLSADQLEALATAGAFDSAGTSRRERALGGRRGRRQPARPARPAGARRAARSRRCPR